MRLSRRAYAKHKGVSETSIRRAIKQGWLTVDGQGKIDSSIADTEWEHHANSQPPTFLRDSSETDSEHLLDAPTQSAYQKSRALKEAYNARLTKLEYDKATGKLIDIEQVAREAFNAGRSLRDRLLHIPNLVAPKLIGKTNTEEMQKIIESALFDAMSVLPAMYEITNPTH